MDHRWKSEKMYEHPAKHQAGTYGNVVLSDAGVYCLQVGGGIMSCPQPWAAKIHAEETGQTSAAFTIRHMSQDLRRKLASEAGARGINMADLAVELIAAGLKTK